MHSHAIMESQLLLRLDNGLRVAYVCRPGAKVDYLL